MGLFLDGTFENVSKSSTSSSCYVNGNVGVNSNCYGNFKFGDMLIQSIPSLFMLAVNKFGEDSNDITIDSEKSSAKAKDDINKQIDEKNNELTAIYTEAQVADYDELSSKKTALSNEVLSLEQEVSGEKSSSAISAKLKQAKADLESDPDDPDLQSAVNTKESELSAAIEKENALNTKKLELAKLEAAKGQADNIKNEILKLKNQAIDKDIQYDVVKESNDIKIFMNALKDFQAAKTEDDKKAKGQVLVDAFKNGDIKNGKEGVQQASVVRAYQMIQPQLEALGIAA